MTQDAAERLYEHSKVCNCREFVYCDKPVVMYRCVACNQLIEEIVEPDKKAA